MEPPTGRAMTTLRALVIHNFYRSENASGENLSVHDEISGLRTLGWDVEVISADSDVIGSGTIPLGELALRPIYSRRSVDPGPGRSAAVPPARRARREPLPAPFTVGDP